MLEHLAQEDEQQDRNIRAREAIERTETAAVAVAPPRAVRRKVPSTDDPVEMSHGAQVGGGASSSAAGAAPIISAPVAAPMLEDQIALARPAGENPADARSAKTARVLTADAPTAAADETIPVYLPESPRGE